jgi:short subunit dehydrogenase-like uncharacterized protein
VNDRKYDLVLYGASGFTGRQTVEYCKQFAPAGLTWAIAGRNRSKLESVNLAGADVLVADAQDDNALDNLARQTRVVLSTAGPFGLYGTKLVAACVRNRTHYCDITGETPGSVSRSIGITRKRPPTVRGSCPVAVSIRYHRISARGSPAGTYASR